MGVSSYGGMAYAGEWPTGVHILPPPASRGPGYMAGDHVLRITNRVKRMIDGNPPSVLINARVHRHARSQPPVERITRRVTRL